MAFVYIFRNGDENLFKIGRTGGDQHVRKKHLSTGNPRLALFDHIETEHEVVCETYLHNRLRSKRFSENEARDFFALTPPEMTDMIREAREFLDEFVPKKIEADRLAKEESDGHLIVPGQQEWDLYRELLSIREDQDSLKLDRALVENRLKLMIGKADGLERIATWRTYEKPDFDERAFRLAEPKLYETFVRTVRVRPFRLL